MKLYILWETSISYDMLGDTEPKTNKEIITVSNNLVYLQLEKERLINNFELCYEKHMKHKPRLDELPDYNIEELHPDQVHFLL